MDNVEPPRLRKEISLRQEQRIRRKMGQAQPPGRPRKAVDDALVTMYIKVTTRRITLAQAAQELGCSIRTLQRRIKEIKNADRANADSAKRTVTER